MNATSKKCSVTVRMPVSVASAAALALLTSLSTATLHAQQSIATTDRGDLEEIVVTATRREEVLSKVPISVVAFSQKRLDQQSVHNVQELAAFVPGLQSDPISNTIA